MDAALPPAADPLIGRTIADKFRIEAFVGRGAMGAVYRATQTTLKKRVAIKVMNPEKKDGTYVSRFKREAKAASRMDHPNLMRVLDSGEEPDGLLYIAMEYLEGRDLLRVLREEYPLTTPRIVAIVSQTLAAIAVAHEMGVVHRDLKPENIMLLASKDDEGNPTEVVKVCDFGVAKILREREPAADLDVDFPEPTRTATQTVTLTAYGTLIGTPEYMSPEQARGLPADARSDLYSLGVILFLMLAGRLPFEAKSKIRLVLKHVEEMPLAPSELDSRIDLRLEAICMKALQKRPQDRYQSAREMRIAVRAVLDDPRGAAPAARREKTTSTPPPALERTPSSRPPPIRPPSSRAPPPDPDLVTTTTMHNPDDMKRAVAEARKRLASEPFVPSIPPPVVAVPAAAPVRARLDPNARPSLRMPARALPTRLLVGVAAAIIVIVTWLLATR